MVSNCIIWRRTKKILQETCESHDSSHAVGFFFVRHHIMQFDLFIGYLGLLYKQCQTPDLVISELYIAAKPKQMKMVLPTIK
jgi:hypothetical protein